MKNLLLKMFYACIIIMMFSFATTNAQIVYSDINPDLTFSITGNTYHLDLNNDGITDYDIKKFSTNAGVCYHTYKTNYYTAILPLNGNKVLNSGSYPKALSPNIVLNSNSNVWKNTASQYLSRQYWVCTDVGLGVLDVWISHTVGNWTAGVEKYVGLKLYVGTNIYYGWLRMTAASTSFTVKDYAYDSTPNHQILTGAISGAKSLSVVNENEVDNNSSESNYFSISTYPNPFSNSTTISFSLEQSENVSLKIFDVNGRLIKTLAENVFEEGEYQVEWNVNDLAEGIYILRIQTPYYSENKKLIIAK